MAHDEYDEFPPLTPAASAVLDAGTSAIGLCPLPVGRRQVAAVIRAAVTQLGVWRISDEFPRVVDATELEAIADNLHAVPTSPSPPPPPSGPPPNGGCPWAPGPVAPAPLPLAADTSYLVAMVRDAIAYKPWETQPQAAVLAVAQWLRSVGNCGSASELEREAAKCKEQP